MTADGGITPGQTAGPFFGYALPYPGGPELVPAHSPGSVLLTGTVLDGAGDPIPDALVELWQADADGAVPRASGSLHRDGITFTGWGRCATDAEGRYRFWTRTPGSAQSPEGTTAAPFFAVAVFARGLLDRLHTRIYLPDDALALERDPLLLSLGSAERETLIARREADGRLMHDIRLQGERETVFLVYR